MSKNLFNSHYRLLLLLFYIFKKSLWSIDGLSSVPVLFLLHLPLVCRPNHPVKNLIEEGQELSHQSEEQQDPALQEVKKEAGV